MENDYIIKKFANFNEAILVLNLTAEDFYLSTRYRAEQSYFSRLKACLLAGLIDIERTIRGTFGCDLSMASADGKMLRDMYPNACLSMFTNGRDVDIAKLSHYLTSLRNINAHAFIGREDKKFLESDFSFLQNQICCHDSVRYLVDGKVTVAGIIFVILSFLTSRSIKTLAKDDFIFSLVSNGSYEADDGERFVNKVSHTNLEIEIRQKVGDNIPTSIFGEMYDRILCDGNRYALTIGSEDHPTFKVDCEIDGCTLTVHKGSLTRTYYKDEYVLKIESEKEFIELSNKLPVFSLVDYLHEINASIFDSNVVKILNQNFERISKLNRPKYYVDKNLRLLVMSNKASDFRIMSSLMIDALSKIFLSTENYIYRAKKRIVKGYYSSLKRALIYIDVPDAIMDEVIFLRNFSVHGYMLNDYGISYNETRQFSLEYIIKTIRDFSDYLKCNHRDVYEHFRMLKCEALINKIVRLKYKIAQYYSLEVIEQYPNYDREELAKKNAFINNSFFDITMFNEITDFEIQKTKIIRVFVPGESSFLYLFDIPKNRELLDSFCSRFGFKIDDEKDYGLKIEINLAKK